MLGKGDVCAAFDKAPRLPAGGASLVLAFNPKGEADLLFPDNLVTFHDIDLFSRYSMLLSAYLGNPLEVWGAFAASWVTVFGKRRR